MQRLKLELRMKFGEYHDKDACTLHLHTLQGDTLLHSVQGKAHDIVLVCILHANVKLATWYKSSEGIKSSLSTSRFHQYMCVENIVPHPLGLCLSLVSTIH